MAKNKKTKKNTNKCAVSSGHSKALSHSGLKTSLDLKSTKPLITISGISKSGPNADNTSADYISETVMNDERLEMDGLDHSLTREPINLGVKNVRQILNCVKDSTLEVKDLILNECNIIYECKICTNLFRSLANFLSHKRIYCKKHFCERMVLFDSTHFQFNDDDDDNCDDNDLEDEDLPTEGNEEQTIHVLNPNTSCAPKIVSPVSSSNTNSSTENINPNDDKPIVSQKRKFIENCVKKAENEMQRTESSDQLEMQLTTIKSNPNAVFQSLQTSETTDECNKNSDNLDKKQIIADLVKEARKSRQTNISQTIKRQRVEEILPLVDNESDVDPNENNENPLNETQKCDICDSTFTSNKTLRVHIKTIHSAKRVVYPCPLCSLAFKQLSNATRHLIQIHKKTKTQANTLKEIMKRRSYSTNSSENSSEVEDVSDEDIEENIVSIETNIYRKNFENKSKSRSLKKENSKPIERHAPRISSSCVYNCGSVFDWAPAKRSHEKSCRKRLEVEKESDDTIPSLETNGSHLTVLSRDQRNNSQKQSEPNYSPELSIVPNPNPNPNSNSNHMSTNLILPNSVEEKIKEFVDLKSLRCTHCPEQDFMNLNQLLQHAVNHIGHSIYKCHGCSYQSIFENDMKYHLMNNHNINEDMIGKHYQTLPNLTQPRLLILPMKSNNINSSNGSAQTDPSPEKNSKLKIHLRTMGNTSKKCYEIVDK